MAGQKQIKAIEALRNQKRRSLFEAQDKIDQQREYLISKIEGKLTQHSGIQELLPTTGFRDRFQETWIRLIGLQTSECE